VESELKLLSPSQRQLSQVEYSRCPVHESSATVAISIKPAH
jgi:hypothetical protein